MRTFTTGLALAALIAAPAVQAAEDPGLTLHDIGGGRALGVGVQVAVTIPLGAVRSAAPQSAPRLSLRAGPSLARTGLALAPRQRSTVAPLAAFTLRAGHSTTWSLAGQPLATRYADPALRQAEAGAQGPRQNISTVGAVAIGVGVAVIVGGLLFIDAVRDSSD